MSEVKAYFQSDLYEEPQLLEHRGEDGHDPHSFVFHDIHAGSILLALDQGNNAGANIYEFLGVGPNPEEAFPQLIGKIIPENITHTIIPFGRSEDFRVKMDDGEPGVISIVHLPLVRITPIFITS